MNQTIKSVLVCVWCFCALWIIASFITSVSWGVYEGPFKDMWWMLPMVERFMSGQLGLDELLSAHGGAHRLLIPRLLYLIDYSVFAGSNRFLITGSLLLQGLASIIWCWQIRALCEPRTTKLFLWCLVLVISFSGMQLENVLYAFDIQWFLANTFALLAIYFCVRHFVGGGRFDQALAVLLGVCAGFSSFLGLCALLLIAVVGLVKNTVCVRAWVWVCLIALFVIWYMSGFESGSYAVFDAVPLDQSVGIVVLGVKLIQWILMYVGSPLTREVPWLGMLLSAMAISIVLVQTISFIQCRGQLFSAPALFFLLAALFALGVAIATGLGRLYFMHTANEDRYQTINLTFWTGFWLLMFVQTKSASGWLKSAAVVCVVVWSAYVGVWWHSKDTLARLSEFERVQASGVAQALGILDYKSVRDTLILGDKTKKINRAAMHGAFLREQSWGVYASAIANDYGKHIPSSYGVPYCAAEILQIERLSAEHWQLALKVDGIADQILFADEQGLLRGAATAIRWKYADMRHVFGLAPPVVEWLGYANVMPGHVSSLKAVMFRNKQPVCEAVILLPK